MRASATLVIGIKAPETAPAGSRVDTTNSWIVQHLPVVLVEGVTTTSERLKAELDSHVSVVVERTELTSQSSSDLSSDS